MKKSFLIFLTAFTLLTGIVTVNAAIGATSNEQQKKKIIRKILASPAVQIYSDNSRGCPITVHESSVKEITSEDFTVLSGETSKNTGQATFPEVTVFNSSDKTIKSFAIAVKSAADKPKSNYFLLISDLSIPPNSTYKIVSTQWVRGEKVWVQKGDKFVPAFRQPGLDSAKSWLPGAASDLKVTIGIVEFTDGTRWMISQDEGW
jgi:hypothetical protein